MNDMGTVDERLASAIKAALSAGEFLMSLKRQHTLEITAATRRDIKLNADRQVEAIIKSELGNALPVLGEETGWSVPPATGAAYWVVDGLDGTVNFLRDIPIAAVSIGLIRNGSPFLGVVYDFLRDELFAGQVGVGATLNGRPLHVSNADDPASALLLSAVATMRDFGDDRMAAFGVSLGRWRKVRMLGSAAISLAYVAAGRADACELAGIMEWDVTAGIALLRAAGGSAVTTVTNRLHVVDVYAHNGHLGAAALV
jgi:myo-inositol-1(or 4)-monophosphatase